MSRQRFPRTTKFGKPTRWLLSISMEEVSKALGSQVGHIIVLNNVPFGSSQTGRSTEAPLLIISVQRELVITLDDEAASAPIQDSIPNLKGFALSGDPECNLFYGCVVPKNRTFQMTGRSIHPAVCLIFSTITDAPEPVPNMGPVFRKHFDLKAVQKEIGGVVSYVYVNNMDRGGTPAGNHVHEHKSERFFPLVGRLKVGQVDVRTHELTERVIDETDSPDAESLLIRPNHGHAVKNIAQKTSRLLVLATGEPRDNDDADYDVYPLTSE